MTIIGEMLETEQQNLSDESVLVRTVTFCICNWPRGRAATAVNPMGGFGEPT
jgi:hypothetical protein